MRPAQKARMLKGFDKFAERIAERYAEARQCLENGQYKEAHDILASLTTSHAKTSLSLKSMLIREGMLEDDSK